VLGLVRRRRQERAVAPPATATAVAAAVAVAAKHGRRHVVRAPRVRQQPPQVRRLVLALEHAVCVHTTTRAFVLQQSPLPTTAAIAATVAVAVATSRRRRAHGACSSPVDGARAALQRALRARGRHPAQEEYRNERGETRHPGRPGAAR
jgi:hypothetical protein